jgi:hypothetical protein
MFYAWDINQQHPSSRAKARCQRVKRDAAVSKHQTNRFAREELKALSSGRSFFS